MIAVIETMSGPTRPWASSVNHIAETQQEEESRPQQQHGQGCFFSTPSTEISSSSVLRTISPTGVFIKEKNVNCVSQTRLSLHRLNREKTSLAFANHPGSVGPRRTPHLLCSSSNNSVLDRGACEQKTPQEDDLLEKPLTRMFDPPGAREEFDGGDEKKDEENEECVKPSWSSSVPSSLVYSSSNHDNKGANAGDEDAEQSNIRAEPNIASPGRPRGAVWGDEEEHVLATKKVAVIPATPAFHVERCGRHSSHKTSHDTPSMLGRAQREEVTVLNQQKELFSSSNDPQSPPTALVIDGSAISKKNESPSSSTVLPALQHQLQGTCGDRFEVLDADECSTTRSPSLLPAGVDENDVEVAPRSLLIGESSLTSTHTDLHQYSTATAVDNLDVSRIVRMQSDTGMPVPPSLPCTNDDDNRYEIMNKDTITMNKNDNMMPIVVGAEEEDREEKEKQPLSRHFHQIGVMSETIGADSPTSDEVDKEVVASQCSSGNAPNFWGSIGDEQRCNDFAMTNEDGAEVMAASSSSLQDAGEGIGGYCSMATSSAAASVVEMGSQQHPLDAASSSSIGDCEQDQETQMNGTNDDEFHEKKRDRSASTSSASIATDGDPAQEETDNDSEREPKKQTGKLHAVFLCQWDEWFELLLKYGEENGHYNVPRGYEIPGTGRKLGRWLQNQRQHKKGGLLTEDRQLRLQTLVEKGGLNWYDTIDGRKCARPFPIKRKRPKKADILLREQASKGQRADALASQSPAGHFGSTSGSAAAGGAVGGESEEPLFKRKRGAAVDADNNKTTAAAVLKKGDVNDDRDATASTKTKNGNGTLSSSVVREFALQLATAGRSTPWGMPPSGKNNLVEPPLQSHRLARLQEATAMATNDHHRKDGDQRSSTVAMINSNIGMIKNSTGGPTLESPSIPGAPPGVLIYPHPSASASNLVSAMIGLRNFTAAPVSLHVGCAGGSSTTTNDSNIHQSSALLSMLASSMSSAAVAAAAQSSSFLPRFLAAARMCVATSIDGDCPASSPHFSPPNSYRTSIIVPENHIMLSTAASTSGERNVSSPPLFQIVSPGVPLVEFTRIVGGGGGGGVGGGGDQVSVAATAGALPPPPPSLLYNNSGNTPPPAPL